MVSLVRNFIRRFYPLILLVGVLLISHSELIFKNQSLAIFYGDSYEQQLQFYLGGWEKLRHLDFSFWDWSLGLGANYFSRVFYFATSPFFLITLLFEKAIIPYLFIYLNMLKMALIFGFAYIWIGKIHSDKLIKTVGAFILTFSGWVMIYYHYNHFLDAFLFYPLILSQIEDYLHDKKSILLPIYIGILGIVNFYFLYMFLPFLTMYAVFRYFVLHRGLNLKHLFKVAMPFIGLVTLGIGLSAVVLIPNVFIILQTPRLSGIASGSPWQTIDFYSIFRYLSTLYTPVMERFNPTYFIAREYDSGIGWGGGVSIYSFALAPLSLVLMFWMKDKRHRNIIYVFYGILLALATFVYSYKLLQGSLDVRWYYMFTILNVYIVTIVLKDILDGHINHMSIWISVAINALIIGVLYVASRRNGFFLDQDNLKQLTFEVAIFCLMWIGLSIALTTKELLKVGLLSLIAIEATFSFFIPNHLDKPIEANEMKSYLKESENDDAIDYLRGFDSDFYRILSDNGLYTSQNDPFARRFNGLSFYASIYNFEQEDYLNRFKSTWSMPNNYGRTNSNFLLSVKYYISSDENHPAPYGFDYLASVNGEKIYQNRYFVPLGFVSSHTLNTNTFKSLSFLNQDRLLLKYIVTDESENTNFEYLNTLVDYGQWIYIDRYYLDKQEGFDDDIVYIENFGLPVVSLTSIKNQEFIKDTKYWQYDYIGQYFPKESGVNAIEIYTKDIYDSKTGYNLYLDLDLSYYDQWYSDISKNFLNNITVNSDTISANITITGEVKWIATSIPYDQGWSLTVNGKNTPISKVNLGFIGFQLMPGSYNLKLKYTPPGYLPGMVISIISLVILVITHGLIRRNQRKQKLHQR